MRHKISADRKTLTIIVDDAERAQLANWQNEHAGMTNSNFDSDAAMIEFLEPIVCNSDLEWISPDQTGDLTDAPMLGILSEPTFKNHNIDTVRNPQNIICSCDTSGLMVATVAERWAFMDYALRSPLADLRDKGECVFVS